MAKLASGLLLSAIACSSGKPQQAPVARDAAVDAAPIDAPPPFVVDEMKSKFGTSVEIRPHGAKCPRLEWRKDPKTVAIIRCRDQPLGAQTAVLRDMVSYMRSIDHAFEDFGVVGLGDLYSYPELAKRFVAYAKTHPYRDKIGIHTWTIEAANSGDMLPELAVIFQRKPRLSSVEKCYSGRATQKSEAGQFIRDAGGTGGAEIPLGCSMAFYKLER